MNNQKTFSFGNSRLGLHSEQLPKLIVTACLTLTLPIAYADAPAPAAAVGYGTNTFSSNFTTSNVDLKATGNPGFSWYPYAFFGSKPNLNSLAVNGDGSLTLLGDTTGPNGEIASVVPVKSSAKFVGTAFGGGGYFEAVLKFNPDDVARAKSKGWPSFWSMALEHVATGEEQWKGAEAGYSHFIEADFFEYDLLPYGAPKNSYGGTMHDWHGKYKASCPKVAFCDAQLPVPIKRQLPESVDLTQYHRYGFLWVPATDGKKGYAEHYFDGKVVGGRVEWMKYVDQPPPAPSNPWAFGILDKQHLVVILGTGVNEPMTVQSVNVWQASGSQNVHQ